MKDLRRKWFRQLKETKGFSSRALLDFHNNAGEGNKEYDLIIDRGFLRTQSISQVQNSTKRIKIYIRKSQNQRIY